MADYAFQNFQNWTDQICECDVLLALYDSCCRVFFICYLGSRQDQLCRNGFSVLPEWCSCLHPLGLLKRVFARCHMSYEESTQCRQRIRRGLRDDVHVHIARK